MYDSNGNLLSQTSSLKHSIYEYNPQNRMVRSRVVDDETRTIASTRYGYDVLGRRTLVQDNNTTTLRTLYDGLGFDVVKEAPVYASGGFTDTYNTGIQYMPAGRATGERYRYLDDGAGTTGEKYQYIEDNNYQTVSSRYTGERTMLYAHGSPVAINRSSGTRGYLGTDILGSTRSVTDNHGVQESYYDYDIFGSPITGNYTTGSDYGYLGKPYDKITGLYNYGYRDYSPQIVRFTTVDPIRDGTNWFAYVNNDPVNYVDLWGLLASDVKVEKGFGRAILSGVGKIGAGTLKTIAGGLGVAAAGLASTVIVADNVTGVLVVNDAALALTVPAAVAAGVYASTGVQEITKGMSEVVKGVSDAIKNSGRVIENPSRSNPLKGEPGTVSRTRGKDGSIKQERTYADDGYPAYDDDFDHDHGQGQPHRHTWNRPENGDAPSQINRQKGEPLP